MATTIIENMSMEDYHADPAYSRSSMMRLLESPYHFRYRHLTPRKESAEFRLGTLVNTLLLEPATYDDMYLEMPDISGKGAKAAKAEFMLKLDGRTLLKAEEVKQANEMVDAIVSDASTSFLLQDITPEVSLFWTCPNTGLRFKSRPDALGGNQYAIDLKTARSASYHDFQRSAYSYGYFLQAGMCHEALQGTQKGFRGFANIVVDKIAPYSVVVYTYSDEVLDYGVELFHKLAKTLAECLADDKWPNMGTQSLMLPGYAKIEEEEETEENDDE